MKKLCEFEIPNTKDRSDPCAILATAGYAARVVERRNYSGAYWNRTYYVVEVFDKNETHQ